VNKDFTSQLTKIYYSNSKNYLVLFLLWPFLAFLLAVKNFSQKESKKVVYIFLIYYGLAFVNDNPAIDAAKYALNLKANSLLPFTDFFKIVGGLYSSDTSIDIVEPFISFIVSRFTSHYGVYFAVWAAIFGFFYLKSISLLHDLYKERPGLNALVFMSFFVVILPITTLSGVRMWTAAWIFFFGAYHVVLFHDKRFLILTLASSLVHWSFLSANAILLIFYFARNANFIYAPLAAASFVVPQMLASTFRMISLRLGGAMQSRYEGYSNEDYMLSVQESSQNSVWFMQIGNDLIFYYLLACSTIIALTSREIMKEKPEKNLFSFMLLFLAFVNFGKAIPSFGGRFQTLFLLFATVYIFLYYLKLQNNKLSLLTWIGLFPMFLFTAVNFRIGAENINAWLFSPLFGSPLIAPAVSVAKVLFY
jgi:hypothetical protein